MEISFQQKTGSVAIALPGKPAGRISNLTPDDIAGASYMITLTQPSGKTITRNAKGGTEVVINDLQPGSYLVNVIASASTYLYCGYKNVTVKAGTIADALVELEQRLFYEFDDQKLKFNLKKIQQDGDSFSDLYLSGPQGLMIKPNLQKSGVTNEDWNGCWPFVSDEPITLYLTGTFGGLWHDNITNPIPFSVPTEMLNNSLTADFVEGKYTIPDMSIYLVTHPKIDQNAKTMSWTQVDSVLNSLGYNTSNVWCELQLWVGEDTASGHWFDGTIFQYGDPEWEESEINKLKSGNMSIDYFTWYDHFTSGPNSNLNSEKPIHKNISEDIGNQKWFVIAQIIYKPIGDNSDYQIVLPGVQSVEN